MKKMMDFVGNRRKWFTLSIIIIALTIICTPFLVKLDIQFTGGTIIKYSFTGDIDTKEVSTLVKDKTGKDATVQISKNFLNNTENLVVTLQSQDSLSSEQQEELNNAIAEKYTDNKIEVASMNNVNPTMGKEFFIKCLLAVLIATILMIIYIAFRFRKIGGWSAGVMGVIALVHDAIVVYAVFLFFGIPLNANFMAAVLTIFGYSINDTIVIYDRIRENKKLMPGRTSVKDLVNTSINQCWTRSLNTTISTVLALTVITIVALLCNVESILSFTFPLIIGMISGVYSTVCIATSLWVMWQERKAKKRK